MRSAVIPSALSYPAVRLAPQPVHQRCVPPGPLVLGRAPRKSQHPRQIGTELSHDVLNPAHVPLLSAAQGGSAGSGDSRARLGHAAATNSRRKVSAPGAGSLADTVSPRARNSAVQLAPIVPVPIAATRVILSPAISVSSLPLMK